MAIEFTPAAKGDLQDIYRYGVEEHGLVQAERYRGQLTSSFQILSENPKIARLRHEIAPPVRVYPARQHIIVYVVLEDEQTVLVLRVRHHRENWTEQPY